MSETTEDFEGYAVTRVPALLRFAYLLTGDRALAEDVVQEALIKVCVGWDRVVAADSADAYVRRMVLNEFLRWRRRRASHEIVGVVPDRAHAGALRALDDIAERDAVWHALRRLPRRQRSVLVLRYYESLPDAEIAAALGCTEGTVRSLASRAFDALRRDGRLRDVPQAVDHREAK